jgi:hypothetical protein
MHYYRLLGIDHPGLHGLGQERKERTATSGESKKVGASPYLIIVVKKNTPAKYRDNPVPKVVMQKFKPPVIVKDSVYH